jgi:hypothetical protein
MQIHVQTRDAFSPPLLTPFYPQFNFQQTAKSASKKSACPGEVPQRSRVLIWVICA